MKKSILIILLLFIVSCGTKKTINTNTLYEVLTEQSDGGANIEFYEVLTEAKEIKMLLNDKNLKNKIQEKDIETCNFVILNLGYKNKGNNKAQIENVQETTNTIVVSIKENSNKTPVNIELGTVNPYMILKINSKKEIVFK
jgi:predicted RNase H-like nuclease